MAVAIGDQVYWLEPYEDEHTPSVVAEVRTGRVESIDGDWVKVHVDGSFRGSSKRLMAKDLVTGAYRLSN